MATLTAEQIKQVLTLVRDQPGFRDALINDPASTLAGIRIPFDASDIPVSPERVILPSDAAIQDKLDALTQQVLGGFGTIRLLLQLDSD